MDSRKPNMEIKTSFFNTLRDIGIRLEKKNVVSSKWNYKLNSYPKNQKEERMVTSTFLNSKNYFAEGKQKFLLTKEYRIQNQNLEQEGHEKNSKLHYLLNKIHKHYLTPFQLKGLETVTHKVFKTDQPSKFVKLRSCLAKIKVKKKQNVKRVEWCMDEADTSRELRFDIQELHIANENPNYSKNMEENFPKKEKAKRKAESHEVKRNVDSSSKGKKNEKKKNYTTKKDKLRKEITKYFYNSDMVVPKNDNYSYGQKKFRKVAKEPLQNKFSLLPTTSQNPQDAILREKFFYKKKLNPKKR
jgi:hypothetical protein